MNFAAAFLSCAECGGDITLPSFPYHTTLCSKFDVRYVGFHSVTAYAAHLSREDHLEWTGAAWERPVYETCERCWNVGCGLEPGVIRRKGGICGMCGNDAPMGTYPMEQIPGVRLVAIRADGPSAKELPEGHFIYGLPYSYPNDLKAVLKQRHAAFARTLAEETAAWCVATTQAVHRELPESQLVLLPATQPKRKRAS